jgi:hypothetical protein
MLLYPGSAARVSACCAPSSEEDETQNSGAAQTRLWRAQIHPGNLAHPALTMTWG